MTQNEEPEERKTKQTGVKKAKKEILANIRGNNSLLGERAIHEAQGSLFDVVVRIAKEEGANHIHSERKETSITTGTELPIDL